MVFIVYLFGLSSCVMRMFTSGWSSLENEVADEWIERDTKERCCGNACCCTRRRSVIRSYSCSIYFLIKALIALGVLWYLVFGVFWADKRFSGGNIHLFVWPLVAVLLFLGLLVFIICTYGCKYTCQTEPPQDVKVVAATLHQHGVYTLHQLNPEERQRVLRECAPTAEQVMEHNARVV